MLKAACPSAVAEELEGESLAKWKTCVDRVKGLGFEDEKAEQIVGQAFGWGKQSYWLNKKENQVPDEDQVLPSINADECGDVAPLSAEC